MQCRKHKDQHDDIKGSVGDGVIDLSVTQVVNKGQATLRVVFRIGLMIQTVVQIHHLAKNCLGSKCLLTCYPQVDSTISPSPAPLQCWRNHSSRQIVLGHWESKAKVT